MNIRQVTVIFSLLGAMSYAEVPLIVAHRGASRDAPENTIPAFKLAWEQGADAIEGDFYQTRDGHIVCIHDKNTKNVSDRKLDVEKSTLEELQKLDVGAHHSKAHKGAVIPTIAEVFATIPEGKRIYIEVKSTVSIMPKLLEEIEKSGLTPEQIIVISFDKNVLQALKVKSPQYKVYWLSSFKKSKFGKITPSLSTVLETLEEINADGFSSNKDRISEAFIKRVMKHGYEYHVWTVDDPATARQFKSWGAASITTNIPGDIRKSVVEYQM